MRDYILLYINGREHRISGSQAFVPVTDFIRRDLGVCGTKVVCAEGDCGACTVMIGRVEDGDIAYKAVNACIQYVFQLDCSHIVTVEGLKLESGLNPVQEAMVNCHGAQCGFCTPGFIVALCDMFERREEPAEVCDIKEELTGNLCRCTGYEAIIKSALAVDPKDCKRVRDLYPSEPMARAFEEHMQQSVRITADGHELLVPVTVSEATAFKNEHNGAVIVSGGTDIGVTMNKRGMVPAHLISTANLRQLEKIERRQEDDREVLEIGARVPLREVENLIKEIDPEFYYILWVFGSPQIRNAGTLAGNIANGSPIADTLPFLFVMDAEVEVEGIGGTRRIRVNQLYEGYKKLAMKPDEMITRIHMPLPVEDEILKLYKVSRRQHLDISAFTAAILLTVTGGIVTSARLAFGGVGPVVMRLPQVENFLVGKEFSLNTFEAAGKIAQDEITPISDVRGSRDYRITLASNILRKFYYETADERELACL